jgi:hypothetical protein
MPIGCHSLVPFVIHELEAHRPTKVLDLGIGFGFYGACVRQWLDYGILPGAGTELVGVEAWPEYRSPLWDLYNRVYCQPLELFLEQSSEQFDAILLMDVIEHFPRDVGESLIPRLQSHTAPGGQVFIGTPAIFMPQGDFCGNPFERHHALWTGPDFEQRGFDILVDGQPNQFGHQMILARWMAPA